MVKIIYPKACYRQNKLTNGDFRYMGAFVSQKNTDNILTKYSVPE